MTRGAIKDKRICVEIGDVGLEGDVPELIFGASPPFNGPFCVSSVSGKYLCTFVTVMRG